MQEYLDIYQDNLLFVFTKNIINTDKKVVVIIKDKVLIQDKEEALTLHYSDDFMQYIDLPLPTKLRPIRKILSYRQCMDIIKRLRYGTLSFNDEGYPYSFGMNHTEYNGHIYFHTGTLGYKQNGKDKKVTYNFIEDLGLDYEIGTHNYRSVNIFGTLRQVDDIPLKRTILLKMLEDTKVNHVWTERMPITTRVYEVEIDYMIGKEHVPENYYEKSSQ